MKKIYFLLFATILFGFVWSNKASGQCEVCQQPNLCYIITYDLPNCPGIQAVICYTCAITHLEAYFEINLRNVCVGLEDEAYENARNWVLNNFALLCGNTPCNVRQTRIKFVRPICGQVENVGGRLNIYKGECNCYKQCIEEWIWCWCNCTPDCDINPDCTPHGYWYLDPSNSGTIGNGNCEDNGWPPPNEKENCTLIHWSRECGQK